MATRSLSPKQIDEIMRLQRQAVATLARLAAKKAVQDQLRAQGVRVSLVPPAEVMRQAAEYLDKHPELYVAALERAKLMTARGVFGKRAQTQPIRLSRQRRQNKLSASPRRRPKRPSRQPMLAATVARPACKARSRSMLPSEGCPS